MVLETDIQQSDTLCGLLQHIEQSERLPFDKWHGHRNHPRRSLAAPVSVSCLTPDGIEHAQWCVLWDISDAGLCVVARAPIEEDLEVVVTLTVKDVTWTGLMLIAHCTQTLNGYKIGMKLPEGDAGKVPGDAERGPASDQARHQVTVFKRSVAEEEWLSMARREITRAMATYARARRTWGLFGVSVAKQIRQMIDQMPLSTESSGKESKRQDQRVSTKVETFAVFKAHAEWRRLPAAFVDISLGGVGLLVPHDLVSSPTEREMGGDWFVYSGMPLMVGMQTDMETLWVPAEIVRVEEPNEDIVRVGVRFATPQAMEYFGAI